MATEAAEEGVPPPGPDWAVTRNTKDLAPVGAAPLLGPAAVTSSLATSCSVMFKGWISVSWCISRSRSQ